MTKAQGNPNVQEARPVLLGKVNLWPGHAKAWTPNFERRVGFRRLLPDNSVGRKVGFLLSHEEDEDQDSDGYSIPAESDEGMGLDVTEQPFYGDE